MLKTTRLIFFVLFLFSTSFEVNAFSRLSPNAPLALVYRGPGVCAENCSEAAAAVAHRSGFRVRYVHPDDISEDLLSRAKIWIQPGGDAIEVAKQVTRTQKILLRKFIARGGAYLGFCAGAFFADAKVDDENLVDGLGIVSVITYDYKTQEKREILPSIWKTGKLGSGPIHKRALYFEEGGYFSNQPNESLSTYHSEGGPEPGRIDVLARYATGEVAALTSRFGEGRVVVSFLHPEAPARWSEIAKLEDPDGVDWDLAEMLFEISLFKQKNI